MLTGNAETIGRARSLRRDMSLPEVPLWRELRKRPSRLRFRRQHPAGPFILDFACLEARFAVEIDGSVHDGGEAAHRDEVRDLWLADQGFRTSRVTARAVLEDIEAAVSHLVGQCQPLHHASHGPPPRAGEDLLSAKGKTR